LRKEKQIRNRDNRKDEKKKIEREQCRRESVLVVEALDILSITIKKIQRRE